jgi:hypothetical protein
LKKESHRAVLILTEYILFPKLWYTIKEFLAGKRAIRFEERVIERGECRILQECLKEKRKKIGKGVWKEREAYF